MALDTYANLQTAIANWLWREGETATEAAIPDMITMAEAHFNRVLKVSDMDAVDTSLAVTAGVATKPSGLRSILSVRETGTTRARITHLPIDSIEALEDSTTGSLAHYDIVGSSIIFYPQVTTTVRLRYRTEIPALADDNTSNWLLAKHPDAYLWTSLAMGESYGMNDPRIAIWKGLSQQAISEIMEDDTIGVNDDGLYVQPSAVVI